MVSFNAWMIIGKVSRDLSGGLKIGLVEEAV